MKELPTLNKVTLTFYLLLWYFWKWPIKAAIARYCACTAMIDSGSWLTNRNRQKRRPATMRILRDFEVFAGTLRMFENKLSGLWPFCLKNKEGDKRATMASNIPEVQLKKYIVFLRSEAVIFEELKTLVYLAMAYVLVVCACFFAIYTVKGLLQLF